MSEGGGSAGTRASGSAPARAGDGRAPSASGVGAIAPDALLGRDESDPYVRLSRARLGKTVRRKWRLDALLGVGGMAAVYAATHRNGSRAAIKMLHPLVANEESKRRFLREGYLANSVQHPGVVQVLDDDEAEDGSIYLVMELLEGESAESFANRRVRLGAPEALAIAEQVLEVLVAAHAKGIVHRDVKPENVFLCTDGRVKLLDFGIARLHEASRSAQATHHGFLLGTPAYMAPEQARGDWEIVDGRTDVWSVGATTFRVMTGRTVHRGTTHMDILLAATRDEAPKVRDVAPEVPELVASLVDRALAYEMRERWGSAAEMLESLRAVHAALGYADAPALRARIAADTTARVELPREAPTESQDFDRAAALESDPLGLGEDDDAPTQISGASLPPSEHARVRSLLFDVPTTRDVAEPPASVEIDLDAEGPDGGDEDVVASPLPAPRRVLRPAPTPQASSTTEGRIASIPPPSAAAKMRSIFDETREVSVARPSGPPAGSLPPPPAYPARAATPLRSRGVLLWWAVAAVSVLLFVAALAWRYSH